MGMEDVLPPKLYLDFKAIVLFFSMRSDKLSCLATGLVDKKVMCLRHDNGWVLSFNAFCF